MESKKIEKIRKAFYANVVFPLMTSLKKKYRIPDEQLKLKKSEMRYVESRRLPT